MRKILFINRYFYPDQSATSQLLSDLAFELASHGSRVVVVTSRMRYEDANADLPRRETIKGVRVRRVWSTQLGRANLAARAVDYVSFYIGAAITLWREADRHTTIVAKTDPPLISTLAAPIAKLRGARLVNWLQDLFPEVASILGLSIARGPFLCALRTARNMSLRSAAVNVVLGERMQALVCKQGVALERITVIPNWSDGKQIRPLRHDENRVRHEWGLMDRFVVGYSGNLGRAHEVSTIIDAAERLRSDTGIVFLFIGGGANRTTLEAQVREKRLPNVLFKPYQPRERLAESLAGADVHLVSLNPTLEGLIVPSKFYGVAAAGRPTLFIGDPDGEVARVVHRGHCGYTVKVGDATSLAQRIRELARAPQLCREMGDRARVVFEREFDRSIAFDKWSQVLTDVARRGCSHEPTGPNATTWAHDGTQRER